MIKNKSTLTLILALCPISLIFSMEPIVSPKILITNKTTDWPLRLTYTSKRVDAEIKERKTACHKALKGDNHIGRVIIPGKTVVIDEDTQDITSFIISAYGRTIQYLKEECDCSGIILTHKEKTRESIEICVDIAESYLGNKINDAAEAFAPYSGMAAYAMSRGALWVRSCEQMIIRSFTLDHQTVTHDYINDIVGAQVDNFTDTQNISDIFPGVEFAQNKKRETWFSEGRYYLGIPEEATILSVEQAYRSLMNQWKPLLERDPTNSFIIRIIDKVEDEYKDQISKGK